MPMNRAFQESGEGSEGRFANFLFWTCWRSDSEYRVHTENTASLLEMQCTEELRTMEVRLLQFNRIPGKEVGGLKLVTTLIEVGTNGLAIQWSDAVQEESGIGNDQSHFPTALSYSFFKRLTDSFMIPL